MTTKALVLAVTSDRELRTAMQQALDRCRGVTVLFARDCDHALKLLQYVRFALVIVEIAQAESTEWNVVEQISASGAVERRAVITITNPDAVARARQAGASECLTKPLDSDTLRDLVQKYLPRP